MTNIATAVVQTEPHTRPAVRPVYETPQVTTYTDAALLEALGPAQAQNGYFRFPPN